MMKILYNEKFKKIKDDLVLYSFITLCCMSILSDSTLIVTDKISSEILNFLIYVINYFILVNLFIDILIYKNQYTWFSIFLILLSIAVFIYAKDNSVFLCIIYMIVLSKYSFDNIANVIFWPMFIVFLGIIILSKINIIPDFIYDRGNGAIRYSLGFYYPTIASTAYLFLLLIRIYLKKCNIYYVEILLHFIISVLIYYFTDSRTGFLLCLIVLIICILYKLFFKNLNLSKIINSRIWKVFLISLPLLSCAIFLLLTLLYYYGVDFAIIIDGLLSERLHYTVNGFSEFPLSLFGAIIHMNGWGGYGYTVPVVDNYDYNYIDNGFMQIFFRFGICTLIAILLIYTLIMNKAVKEKNYSFIAVMVVILINCMIEPNLIYYTRNIFILYSSSFLYKYINKEGMSLKYNYRIIERYL